MAFFKPVLKVSCKELFLCSSSGCLFVISNLPLGQEITNDGGAVEVCEVEVCIQLHRCHMHSWFCTQHCSLLLITSLLIVLQRRNFGTWYYREQFSHQCRIELQPVVNPSLQSTQNSVQPPCKSTLKNKIFSALFIPWIDWPCIGPYSCRPVFGCFFWHVQN